MNPEVYLSLVTMHGTMMVFFVLTTAPQGGFGNYFLPIQIGADDMAFPVLNMLSFWVTLVGIRGCWSRPSSLSGGAPTGGWTGYPTLSAIGEQLNVPGRGWARTCGLSVSLSFAWRLCSGALNFITTLLNMRTRGHDADADAADVLELVYDRRPCAAGFPGAARRRRPVAARSIGGDEFLRAGRLIIETARL